MRDADVPAAHQRARRSRTSTAGRGEPATGAAAAAEVAHAALHHLLATDPGGAGWPSATARSSAPRSRLVREGAVGAVAAGRATRRAVGGRRPRAAAPAPASYGDGARGGIILASLRPAGAARLRARRLRAAPGVDARAGAPRAVAAAAGGAPGHGPRTAPLTDAVDRAVRGAAHGERHRRAGRGRRDAARPRRAAASHACAAAASAAGRGSTRRGAATLLRAGARRRAAGDDGGRRLDHRARRAGRSTSCLERGLELRPRRRGVPCAATSGRCALPPERRVPVEVRVR